MIFFKCDQNHLRHLWLNFFIFQISGIPKGGCTPLWGLDSDIWLEYDMESHMTHMTRPSVIIGNAALISLEYYP